MAYDDIRDYRMFYNLLRDRIPAVGKCYVLLNEVQQVVHWEKAVNSLNAEPDIEKGENHDRGLSNHHRLLRL
jgi:predicted AAA+ superfamily ATPase